VKNIFWSVTRVLSNEVRRVFNGEFTSRQGIAGFFSSGSWILPATAGLTGLTFREEISSIIGKFFRHIQHNIHLQNSYSIDIVKRYPIVVISKLFEFHDILPDTVQTDIDSITATTTTTKGTNK
jgi:hypothetical protein